jgi:hypothetical protein
MGTEDRVRILVDRETSVILNGEPYVVDWSGLHGGIPTALARHDSGSTGVTGSNSHSGMGAEPPSKRKRGSLDDFDPWIVRKGQWRLRVQPASPGSNKSGAEVVLVAVKLEAFTEPMRNTRYQFLT